MDNLTKLTAAMMMMLEFWYPAGRISGLPNIQYITIRNDVADFRSPLDVAAANSLS